MRPPFSTSALRQSLPDLSIRGHVCSGGQKHVFRCKFNRYDGALKVIPKTPSAEARARREVEIMRLANSPNLVKILTNNLRGIRVAGIQYIYFIEEYIDGEDLSNLINQNWSYDSIIRLTRDLVSAVKELWNHRVVHRDVKPGNIRIRHNGQAVLLDVGLACHIDRSRLTPPLAIPGTFGYYSPEQLRRRRRNLDFRSDLFLIGICLYELIKKRNPFTEGTQNDDEYIERVLRGLIPSITDVDTNIPSSFADLIMRLLKPFPNLRPRSFETIELMLRSAEEEILCRS